MKKIVLFVAILVAFAMCVPTARAATEEQIEESIENGIAWLVAQQEGNPEADGSWPGYYGVDMATTGLAVLKLEHRAYELGYDSPFDPAYPYHQNVIDGLNYIFGVLQEVDIDDQDHTLGASGTVDDPDYPYDGTGNGKGVYSQQSWSSYETGIVLAAVAASGTPNRVVNVIGSVVDNRKYIDVAQDMVDWIAWAQSDAHYNYSGELCGEGGWYYYALDNSSGAADNSITGYVTLGLAYAQDFGCTIPDWVLTELNAFVTCIQDPVDGDANGYDGGSWYRALNNPIGIPPNILKTGNLIFEMAMVGDNPSTPRVVDALDYLVRHWGDASGSNTPQGWVGRPAQYQAMFTTMKGLEYMGVDVFDGIDWYLDFSDTIVSQQIPQTDPDPTIRGSWQTSSGRGNPTIITAWALLTLEKVSPPPEGGTVIIPNTVYERFGFGHWDYEGEIILDDACPPWYGVNPGDFFEIPIILEDFGPSYPIGGFELEVEFDYIDLTFYGAMRGILLEKREFYPTELDTFFSWEYFSYRLCPCTVPACLKYKILLYGQAEMPDGVMRKGYCLSTANDWPYTYWAVDSTTGSYPQPEGAGCCQFPDGCCSCEFTYQEGCEMNGGIWYPNYGCNEETGLCGPPDQEEVGATLVWLKFQVANNELLRDLKLPIFFEWEHKLAADEMVIIQDWDCAENTMSDCEGNNLYVSKDPLQYEPNVCPDGNNIHRMLDFVDGGVHICSPCTSFYCVRGDINMDEIPYTTADAVLFARYFVYGLGVFIIDRDNQVCATDVNADGRTLMLADLIYLIRVIQKDAAAYPKLGPSSDVANVIVSDGRITTECASPIGGLLFEFDGHVGVTLLNDDMEIIAHDGKVLVWSSEGNSINAGVSELLSVAGAELVSVTAVDREGRELTSNITAKVAPSTFALYPAYPNPFNPYTNLSFTLPNATAYSMKIYNVAGQLVRSYDGMGTTGLNVITWDGEDNLGDEVASGIYFYKLVAGQHHAIKKMVMLK